MPANTNQTPTDAPTADDYRVDELEKTIEDQRETIDEQAERIDELENDVENIKRWLFNLEDAVSGEYDVGTLTTQAENGDSVVSRIEALENGEAGGTKVGGQREKMLPAHKMYADLLAGDDTALGTDQRRAARIFGLFVERAVDDESNKVDASGQIYSITSGQVEEVLVDAEEFDGVKESSYSQLVSRVMRQVASLSKRGSCDCDKLDGCVHANVRFRSGRPNKLASPKNLFNAHMDDVYGGGGADQVSTEADTDDASEQGVEGSVDETFSQLDNAEVEGE